MAQQAFVLRISPSRIDRVSDALASDQIIIGWSKARGLLDLNLSWKKFREIINRTYYANEANLRKAGSASGNMSRFIREMNKGDLVVVPHGPEFFIAEMGDYPATYDESKIEEDTAYRRSVTWLNDKKAIPRSLAKSALVSRMKIRGACAYATDLLPDIKECLQLSKEGNRPTFQSDLQTRLILETLKEIRSGRMDPNRFEALIRDVMKWLGATEARVVSHNIDKGADIIATFQVAGVFQEVVAVQAKYWLPEPPVGKKVVEQLIQGIEAESADMGIVITAGSISEDAVSRVEQYFEEKGVKIELVDGEQLAKMIVEYGIKTN